MRRVVDRRSLLPLVAVLAALFLVAYFDLQTSIPILDEYARRWTIQRIADGRGLVFWGDSPNLAEIALALPAALLRLDPRIWRLAGLPFLAGSAIFAWLIAFRLGADRFWAAIAAALVVASPIVLSLATGMMTETAFVCLLLAGAWFALRWISDGKAIPLAVLLAGLATLQRQQGIALAAVVTVGLFLVRRERPLRRRDVVGLAAIWVAVAAALGSVYLYHSLGPSGPGGDAVSFSHVVVVVTALAYLPIVLGFMALPVLVGLLGRPDEETRLRGRVEIVPVVLAVFSLVFVLLAVTALRAPMFVGYIFGAKGLSDARELAKPDLLPLPVFLAIEVLTLAMVVVLLVWRRKAWRPSVLGVEGVVLVVLAGTQFLAILVHGQVFDRYCVAVMAPVAPLLAALASRSSPRRWGALWAAGSVVGGLALYGVGEQDFLAWLQARDQAAQVAYAQAPPEQVLAGFEEIAIHVWIPAMDDSTGTKPRSIVSRPRLELVSVGPDDPRPGFSYTSIAPGKIVVEINP